MKVGELIEQLSEYDPEMEVLTATDEEGNNFHKVVTLELEMYVQDGREIEIHHPKDYEDGYYEGTYAPNCVVIWP